MTEQQKLQEDIAKISDVVTAARGLVSDGQIINIQPLEKEVERVCASMVGLDADTARKVQPVLLALMDELDQLAKIMNERYGDLSDELKSTSDHIQATAAYSSQTTEPKK